MSKDKIIFSEQDFYRTLKKHDKDILARFNDKTLSDNDYFFCGISSDIVSNALSILVNKFTNNIDSIGVDNSCRAIIEALTILKMDGLGLISDLQKSIYRYQYTFVDFDNFRKILSEEDKVNPLLKNVKEERRKATEYACKHFNCSSKDIKSHNCDDPMFYLKKRLNDDIRPAKLVEKYMNELLPMYNFFSILIHPRFEKDREVEKSILKIRKDSYINNVLNLVFNFLRETKLLVIDHTMNDFNKDFYENPLLQANVFNLNGINKLFANLENELCDIGNNQFDAFTYFYLEKMRGLIFDLQLNMSLGYKEHVISKFKSFIEYTSICIKVNREDNEKDFYYTKYGYLCSSRLQLEEHIKSLGGKEIELIDRNLINDLYEKYYKGKYTLSSKEAFIKEMTANSLYFLGNEEKSYTKYVNEMIEFLYKDTKEQDRVKFLYKYAKDEEHASGYNFNSSEGIWSTNCFLALHYTFKILVSFLFNAKLTLEEHDLKPRVDFDIKAFIEISNIYYNEYLKTVKSYMPQE